MAHYGEMTRCPGFNCKVKKNCRRYTANLVVANMFTERPRMAIFDPPCVEFLPNGIPLPGAK